MKLLLITILLAAGCQMLPPLPEPDATPFIPAIPTEGRNDLYWKEQFDPNDGHFGYPPCRRIKVTMPEWFAEGRDVSKMQLAIGSITVGPYKTHDYTDEGKPQFQIRRRKLKVDGGDVDPRYDELMAGPATVTLTYGTNVLMRFTKQNPAARYTGQCREITP